MGHNIEAPVRVVTRPVVMRIAEETVWHVFTVDYVDENEEIKTQIRNMVEGPWIGIFKKGRLDIIKTLMKGSLAEFTG